jgi:multiple sugar transport system permease protein
MQANTMQQSWSDLDRAQARAGYLFVFPSLALYVVFVLAPVVVTFILSFTYYDPMAGSRWVGFDNFVRFFTDDRSLQIFWNTLRFTLFAVTGNVCVGLLLALGLNRRMPASLLYLFRLAYFLPVIIAAAFVSIVWGYFYGDDLGVINYYLIRLGFSPVHWLTSSRTAMMSIIIMDVWKNAGFFMIIFIAALQSVPKTLMEAAVMDGASASRRFFRITLPWISPVVFFAIVYASIGALQVFESVVILTRGGPGDATRSMSLYIVEEAFDSFEIGYAASVAVVMTLVILAITCLQLLASR